MHQMYDGPPLELRETEFIQQLRFTLIDVIIRSKGEDATVLPALNACETELITRAKIQHWIDVNGTDD